MSGASSRLGVVADNPFYVLALAPDASRAAIERQGQTLLDQLELRDRVSQDLRHAAR